MNWALDHLQLLIAIGGAVAWWLHQHKQTKAAGEEPPPKATFDDPELAERTRRIREEIQRKIEQRARAYTRPVPPEDENAEPAGPPPIVREVAVFRPSVPPPMSRAATAQLEDQRTAEILEQQAALVEQLRQVDERKATAMRHTQFESAISTGDHAAAAARSALGDDLRDPDVLRRAFILREILGPPVALRR